MELRANALLDFLSYKLFDSYVFVRNGTIFFTMDQENQSESESLQDTHQIIPCRRDSEAMPTVDVDIQALSFWKKTEVYLKLISVPLIIVAVTVVGFLISFFREIIIPTVLALFLFQISKPIVLRLHRPIIPYIWFQDNEVSEEEKVLIDTEDKPPVHDNCFL